MQKKISIYIASPYSNGNREKLAKLQLEAAYHLIKLGFNPYAPLYNHYIQIAHPDLDKNFNWLEIDLEWLDKCDMAIRLHFKDDNNNEIYSPGADEEEKYCVANNIPIFHFDTIEEMVNTLKDFDVHPSQYLNKI